jgi:hypothetical protein
MEPSPPRPCGQKGAGVTQDRDLGKDQQEVLLQIEKGGLSFFGDIMSSSLVPREPWWISIQNL